MPVISKIRTKARNFIRGRVQKWGPAWLKQKQWDQEFADGRWDFIENTSGDLIYQYLEKYCQKGSLLDLGCGSGNTGCELAADAYETYVGVDISEVALNKARQRSGELQRNGRNQYFRSDIATYVPNQAYNVILFRESIYYIPEPKITGLLERYSRHLKPGGVLIVRWHEKKAGEKIIHLIESAFKIVEKHIPAADGPVFVVFNKG